MALIPPRLDRRCEGPSYALRSHPTKALLGGFLEMSDARVWEGAMDARLAQPTGFPCDYARLDHSRCSRSDVRRRALAARARCGTGDEGIEELHKLLADPEPSVVAAACRAASKLRNRVYVYAIVGRMSDVRIRGVAIEALAAYGPMIVGTLADFLVDGASPLSVRRQIPRALRLIVNQRSVDVLLTALYQPSPVIRSAALKALNRLRESAPQLHYADELVTVQIHQEARQYFELIAALAPFRDQQNTSKTASLLTRTIEERLHQTLDRLFRLLGLRYPPREIYSAYLAVSRRQGEHLRRLEF
jgi:hypothetical protein